MTCKINLKFKIKQKIYTKCCFKVVVIFSFNFYSYITLILCRSLSSILLFIIFQIQTYYYFLF